MTVEKKEFKPDSVMTAETKLTVLSASYHGTTVRMEVMGFGPELIKVNERTESFTMKLDFGTLICLRDILNRWHEKTVKP